MVFLIQIIDKNNIKIKINPTSNIISIIINIIHNEN